MNLGQPARVFRPWVNRPSGTAASGWWKDVAGWSQLLRQFVTVGETPLKRLDPRDSTYRRAEATVLMRGIMAQCHCLLGPSFLTRSARALFGRPFYRRDAKSAEIPGPVLSSAFFAHMRFVWRISLGYSVVPLRNVQVGGHTAPLIEPHA
jgi:hypothetical protein